MPRNGSGTYTLPEAPFVAGTVISSAAVNDDLSDIANALTGSLPRDGQAGMTGQFSAVDGSVGSPSISFNNEEDSGFYLVSAGVIGIAIAGVQVGTFGASGFQGQGSVPISAVMDLASNTIPSFWYLCYGQAVSRTTYALLFAAIGTTYGSGDGTTTFNLPDLRGMTTYGRDDMGGSAAGRLTTTYFGTNPTVTGNAGGVQSNQLIGANLPAYTPTGLINVTDPGHGHVVSGGTVGGTGSTSSPGGGGPTYVQGPASIVINSSITNLNSGNVLFAGVAQGGTSTLFSNVSPGRIMNKIIYAGA